ncbi:hypothetical protein Tco_1540766 [Tanacetum coccineum]
MLNKETMRIEESLNVTFDESMHEPKSSPLVEDDRIIDHVVQNPVRSPSLEANATEPGYPKSLKEARGHLIEQVIGDLNERTLSNFEDSSFHNNNGIRMMSPDMEDYYPWEEIKSSNIDICRAFLKLCVVEDPIWEKITCELEEPFRNTHIDECVCCQVQHMTEENVYALRKEMRDIHASINTDLKVLTAVVEDIARVCFHDNNEE